MSGKQYQISEAGYVYRILRLRKGRRRMQLGHISCLLVERSARGRRIKDWWATYLRRLGCAGACNRSQQLANF